MDQCFISSGGCTIEEYFFLGESSALREEISVKNGYFIGMGDIFTKDTVEGGIYFDPKGNILKVKTDALKKN